MSYIENINKLSEGDYIIDVSLSLRVKDYTVKNLTEKSLKRVFYKNIDKNIKENVKRIRSYTESQNNNVIEKVNSLKTDEVILPKPKIGILDKKIVKDSKSKLTYMTKDKVKNSKKYSYLYRPCHHIPFILNDEEDDEVKQIEEDKDKYKFYLNHITIPSINTNDDIEIEEYYLPPCRKEPKKIKEKSFLDGSIDFSQSDLKELDYIINSLS